MPSWDPQQYERFADHRTRPFFDLLARVGADRPARVVDLGCGNGPLTLALADRWPGAAVTGVDSSAQMLERARNLDDRDRVTWQLQDVTEWQVGEAGAPDVIVSNATLQWVPEHRELIPEWLAGLAPGGWFAMQVPGTSTPPRTASSARSRPPSPTANGCSRATG